MSGTILVLGASGRFGRSVADEFARAGWTVRGFDRGRDDLDRAAAGVDLIAVGWNPPYHKWAAELPGLHAQVRRAALRHDATVLLPGNVYVFGPGTGPVWDETTPHRATNPLGRLRIDMEAAYRAEGVRTILLRAGDFLDTEASGNWFDRLIAQDIRKGVIHYPAPVDVPHAWAFLPDLARAFHLLAERRDDLPRFCDVPFPGYTLTGDDLACALGRVMGQPVRIRPMRFWPLRLLRPVMPVLGGVFEMKYLWNLPHSLSAARFGALVPEFAATPVDQALAAAIAPLR
ncbi:Nucleoside-diphosphate-sugar epimerase [Lutimaribacter pacificus]|uniref:dTDP-4-dehydrorhamnose reductase n=1 Tax=Lutimaribacter pacificus TaxID=391948 RepID=A0A1H0CA61_9RHOB|nr:epimerase [Lutimaribacter pacificus]SDN54759.1 Nucleoside-diphosphate-sugar epimerase [Lutimaribacter pacificus]SHJ46879.1 dTDP-4-dehydrorhamnose reductase [Lutimaribacter pacificus]